MRYSESIDTGAKFPLYGMMGTIYVLRTTQTTDSGIRNSSPSFDSADVTEKDTAGIKNPRSAIYHWPGLRIKSLQANQTEEAHAQAHSHAYLQ